MNGCMLITLTENKDSQEAKEQLEKAFGEKMVVQKVPRRISRRGRVLIFAHTPDLMARVTDVTLEEAQDINYQTAQREWVLETVFFEVS